MAVVLINYEMLQFKPQFINSLNIKVLSPIFLLIAHNKIFRLELHFKNLSNIRVVFRVVYHPYILRSSK